MRAIGRAAALSVAAVVLAAPAAHGATPAAAAHRATFTDEQGEQPGSADITRVDVSNDGRGRITFVVFVSGRSALTQDMRIRIWLRDQGGRDSFLLVDPFTPSGFAAQLYRCKRRDGGLVCSPSQRANLRFSYTAGRARFALDAEDLGLGPGTRGATRLSFWVATLAGVRYDPTSGYDLADAHFDRAPSTDGAYWRYIIRRG